MNDPIGSEDSRLETPNFWEELQETFETAVGLLHELAEAQGLDASVPEREAVRDEEERLDKRARGHVLAVEADVYAQKVDRWFRGAKDVVRAWGVEASASADFEVRKAEIEADADALQEAVETIADARYRIGVKLLRALRTRMRSESMILSPIPGAAEQAAAEAYVLVEDSIKHWMRIREIIPAEEDVVLELLQVLGRIRDGIEDEFVQAIADSTDIPDVDPDDSRNRMPSDD